LSSVKIGMQFQPALSQKLVRATTAVSQRKSRFRSLTKHRIAKAPVTQKNQNKSPTFRRIAGLCLDAYPSNKNCLFRYLQQNRALSALFDKKCT